MPSDTANTCVLDLIRASKISIKRHVKIKGEATPYDPVYTKYFAKRKLRLKQRINTEKLGRQQIGLKKAEPCEGKLSRTVLRGVGRSNAACLLGTIFLFDLINVTIIINLYCF